MSVQLLIRLLLPVFPVTGEPVEAVIGAEKTIGAKLKLVVFVFIFASMVQPFMVLLSALLVKNTPHPNVLVLAFRFRLLNRIQSAPFSLITARFERSGM